MKLEYKNLLGQLLLLATLLMGPYSVVAGELVSVVDRNEVGVNDTFRLQVSYDQPVDSGDLDLSGLAADFEVLTVRPQSSSAVSIVNGQRSQTVSTVWSMILAPKRRGVLTIPAFTIGQDSSAAIEVKVGDGGERNNNQAAMSVDISFSHTSIYPGQQLIVEIELSAQSGVSNLNGPELAIVGADVIPLDQQSLQRVDNGIARTIVILKYAVFAKSEGEIVVPVMTYTGNKGGQASLFASRGQQVFARTHERKIKVQPAPRKDAQAWFPAENVALSSNWSRDPSSLKVGEPITRTVTITAVAQQASAIPPLPSLPESSDYNSYADQPQLNDKKSTSGFISTRVESEAIVATREGELQIPETRIAWFDVGAKRWKEAVLPAETISAKGGSLSAAAPNNVSLGDNGASQGFEQSGISSKELRYWQLATALLALLSLVQLAMIYKLRSRKPQTSVKTAGATNETAAWKALQAALKSNSAVSIRKALLAWINAARPSQQVWTLHGIKSLTEDTVLSDELDRLESSLFKQTADEDGGQFNAARLTPALNSLRKKLNSKSDSKDSRDELSALYRS